MNPQDFERGEDILRALETAQHWLSGALNNLKQHPERLRGIDETRTDALDKMTADRDAIFERLQVQERLNAGWREDYRLRAAARDKRPEIVCICGSSRFCDLAAVHAWNFEKMGKIALSMHLLPDWYWQATNKVGRDHAAEQEGVAAGLDELHLRKIDLCDLVFVVNKDGYIGERTRIEIDYASSRGKRIEYLEALQPAQKEQ